MPPVLNPQLSKVDGLAFLGLSLCRKSDEGHPDSITHQTAYDLNDVIDRKYEYLASTNDDGWLVGGGEPGPPKSYKLPAKDSAHVEIMRIGTYNPEWGGIDEKVLVDVMRSGKILIPQIEVLPTAVVANPDTPPELEIRFDMPTAVDFVDMKAPLPVNWQLRFIHNQLFKVFHNPSRFCPGAFHSTIVRKAEFRSQKHKDAYFAKCAAVITKWAIDGPKALNNGPWDAEGKPLENPGEYNSGIYLFTDRTKVTHFFPPNFLPPYDTEEKRQIILSFLAEEWDEKTLSWKKSDTATEMSFSSKILEALDCGNPIEKLMS
mmetsp:Transcript_19150/g.27274  ORF Transcript_19150/g.27274 Transcript_19150/m.27274 type:complete len:318 (+) Transcript_19150:172-1125(+)|eukprot:CAMPEP_0201691174 /NCGR_PEP_ID=MMETSP0578-20130828/4412_1 /ASSEMBLY_ACC=CAM_ASM_000663 /TAXON_ID=267565 /ORGANISM="Skeletonema grethea, Strain CCMP 1804" /LENGTH=317 /DNA_ID=CAMNT_0048176331 /DNA_START=155 /DNA_END=1108 /DNA_ORIENTATION=+